MSIMDDIEGREGDCYSSDGETTTRVQPLKETSREEGRGGQRLSITPRFSKIASLLHTTRDQLGNYVLDA